MPEDYIPDTIPESEEGAPEEGVEPSGEPSGGGPGIRDRVDQGRNRLDQFRDKPDRKDMQGERKGEGGPKSRSQKKRGVKQAKKPGVGKEGADKIGKTAEEGAKKATDKAAKQTTRKGVEEATEKGLGMAGWQGKVAAYAIRKSGGWKSTGKKMALAAGGIIVGGVVLIVAFSGIGGSGVGTGSSSVVIVNGGTFPVPPEYDYSYSDTWGACRGGSRRGHQGVDIMADLGTPSVACVTGEITRAKKEDTGNSGRYIIIKDDVGNTYHYMHMETVSVNVGDKVNVGDLIGTIGSTGNASVGGEHIHFEFHPASEGSSRTAFDLLCSWDTKPPSSCPTLTSHH